MTQPGRIESSDLSQRAIDPPIVDFLSVEDDGSYLVTFVPQDSVSHQDKETVLIGRSSAEGQRIAAHLARIAAAVGASGNVARLSHAGGADFTFHFSDTRTAGLSRARLAGPALEGVLADLEYIAVSSELAFLIKQRQSAA